MTHSPHERRRRIRRVAIAALVALGLLVGLLWRRAHKPPTELAADATAPAAASLPPLPPPSQPAEDPNRPIIDEVTVEKKEVCRGEENLISVKAHTPNNADPFLKYIIGATKGQRVPLKEYASSAEQARSETPPHRAKVIVFSNNSSTMVDVPVYKVKECTVPRSLEVFAQTVANTSDTYRIYARVRELGARDDPKAKALVPVKYTFWFGDGKHETTTEPSVMHDYGDRPQDTLYSQFLVKVEATDKSGQKLVGRVAIEAHNYAFENLVVKKTVILLFSFSPRFPQMGADRIVRQRVRIWHLRPEPVTITSITLTRTEVDGTALDPHTVNVAQFLGTTQIPPGPGIEQEFTLNVANSPRIFQENYKLEGRSAEGYHVSGLFSIMRPPDLPTREVHQEIDPMLKARILAARRILGKRPISHEEIVQLEYEGRLKIDPNDLPPGYLEAQKAKALERARGAGGPGPGGAPAPVPQTGPQ